jgi:hypothetical protein
MQVVTFSTGQTYTRSESCLAGCCAYLLTGRCFDSQLADWLWSTFIQEELDRFRAKQNNHKTKLNRQQKLPSGISPNEALERFQDFGGEWCLQPVDLDLVRSLMDALGGEQLMHFNSLEYRRIAQQVFESLNVTAITGNNIWAIYQEMLPRMTGLIDWVQDE